MYNIDTDQSKGRSLCGVSSYTPNGAEEIWESRFYVLYWLTVRSTSVDTLMGESLHMKYCGRSQSSDEHGV